MYRIIPDTAVSEQVAALPTEALASYAEVLDAPTSRAGSGALPFHTGPRTRSDRIPDLVDRGRRDPGG